MALHRKQRGVVDTSPQYVRIPTAGGRAVGYSLHEAHSSPQRVNSKRYMAGDRSRKISSLQLRACFLLCVLLYFGAIYFADDIASIGRVVGSEQNSQNFFVHSLRPRGRNVRIGRAVDTKKTELAAMPAATAATLNEHQHQLEETIPPMKVSEAVTQSPQVEFAKPEEAELMESVKQAERPADLKHHDQQKELIDASGDAVHPDDQGGDAPADQIKHAEPIEKASIDQATALPVEFVKTDDHQHSGLGQEQGNDLKAAMKNHRVVVNDEPRPTAAARHHEKEAHVDAIPAASPSRVIQKQFAHGNIDDKPKHPQQLKRNQELGEIRPVVTRQQRRPADVTINGERGEENDPVATPAQMKEGLTEHISDI